MNGFGLRTILAGLCTYLLVTSAGAACPDASGPRSTVESYLGAMQAGRFEDAFALLSGDMTDHRSRDDWVALQRTAFSRGQVEIYGVDVRRPGEASQQCPDRATVPNILRSRDRANIHGVVEFEIYTVEHTPGGWKIADQRTLYDPNTIHVWFPDVVIQDLGMLP